MNQKKNDISYGIDAPIGILQLIALGTFYILCAWPIYWWVSSVTPQYWASVGFWLLIVAGLFNILLGFLMVFSSLFGKPHVIRDLVKNLYLDGSEQVLDLGCGTGMLLIEVAKNIPRGHIIGLDIWETRDQQPNSYTRTLMNANREGVEQRVDLKTGDMRKIPFADGSFDVVVSSLAIHNVPSDEDREQVLREIVRVLKPAGRFALVDFQYTDMYAEVLQNLGCKDVSRSSLDFRMFPPVRIVMGRK